MGCTDQLWFVVRFDCKTRISTQVVIKLQTIALNVKCALLSPVGCLHSTTLTKQLA